MVTVGRHRIVANFEEAAIVAQPFNDHRVQLLRTDSLSLKLCEIPRRSAGAQAQRYPLDPSGKLT